eukprot:1253035-Amphidinium_carterae.1
MEACFASAVCRIVFPFLRKEFWVQAQWATKLWSHPSNSMLGSDCRPGDVLFFSFSGYGLQVDDMDGDCSNDREPIPPIAGSYA